MCIRDSLQVVESLATVRTTSQHRPYDGTEHPIKTVDGYVENGLAEEIRERNQRNYMQKLIVEGKKGNGRKKRRMPT